VRATVSYNPRDGSVHGSLAGQSIGSAMKR